MPSDQALHAPDGSPWNKGQLIGQKRPLKPKDVWAIRVRLQLKPTTSSATCNWESRTTQDYGQYEAGDVIEAAAALDGWIGRVLKLSRKLSAKARKAA